MTEVRCVETREEEGGGEGTEGARSRNERSLMHLRIGIAFSPLLGEPRKQEISTEQKLVGGARFGCIYRQSR